MQLPVVGARGSELQHALLPQEFSVLSLNVEGLPAWLTGLSNQRYQEIGEKIRESAPDIVLLQEAWFRAVRPLFPADYQQAASLSLPHIFQRSGLAILSRYPIQEATAFHFSDEAGRDAVVSKGALKVILPMSTGRRAAIWCSHLQSADYAEVRAAQIRELSGWIDQHSADADVVVVGLDANCEPGDAEYTLLRELLGAEFVSHQSFATHWDPATKNWHALDHLFVRSKSALGPVIVSEEMPFETIFFNDFNDPLGDTQRLCDHRPLSITVSVPNSNAVETARATPK